MNSTVEQQTKKSAPGTGKDQWCAMIAAEIMTTPVQCAQQDWSVKMLLEFFQRHGISGAPVITGEGDLVGVVTLSDIMKFENLAPQEKQRMAALSCYSEYFAFEFSGEDIAKMIRNSDMACTVNQIMTPAVIQVDRAESVVDVARLMREKKIHRVFVSSEKKIVGVISTSNLLDTMIESCRCQ